MTTIREICASLRKYLMRIIFIGCLAWVYEAPLSLAQISPNAQNNPVSLGKSLTPLMVAEELERIMRVAPKSDVSLWNAGYDFFRRYPHNQDTAKAIQNGFLRARSSTPQQKDILFKAAIYWEKIHDYGIANVPVAEDNSQHDRIYYGQRQEKLSTLKMRQSGSEHKSGQYNQPGQRINQKEPYKRRSANPYPGKYYPGIYPP